VQATCWPFCATALPDARRCVILDFKRNRRIVPEASTFAYFTLEFFAFCTNFGLMAQDETDGPLCFPVAVTLVSRHRARGTSERLASWSPFLAPA